MAGCKLNCAPVVGCERCGDAKRTVEGECCVLLYNDDMDWFDEEFWFGNSEDWFRDAVMAGLKERDEMLNGYKKIRRETPVVEKNIYKH
jgi:hypothetical protein